MNASASPTIYDKIEALNEIGIALSAEQNTTKLLDKILIGAKSLTSADGGTLYRLEGDQLKFDVVLNDTLDIKLGGSFTKEVPIPPLPLKKEDGSPNLSAVAAYVANKGEAVNIEDIYNSDKFDFSGALDFDKKMNYRTQSMLAIPLKNFEGVVIGVLQLINAKDETGKVIPFNRDAESLARSLASQAAIALTNKALIDEHKNLFESFSELIADAIDKKSPYTGKHCQRVPVITMMLAKAADQVNYGPLKDFHLDENDFFELSTAAWLHDCGKLTTPEYIMDKSTKLETVFDRIELVKTRLTLKAVEEIAERHGIPQSEIEKSLKHYHEIYERLVKINKGGEFLKEADKAFVEGIAQQPCLNLEGESCALLTEDEKYNLIIERGTLNPEERKIMEDHAAMTIHMLNLLPFPKELQHVPEYAGGHHERMDGKGYPRHLTREQLSIPARIMGIADIYEALSAGDRPYKEAKKLSESLKILGYMKQDGHIDPDLFDIFIREKVYMEYAKKYLNPEQIDEVNPCQIPGFDCDKQSGQNEAPKSA
jgi:HD-GYP domain-containing protein (c-di-GMP phosphodiesterase class II)